MTNENVSQDEVERLAIAMLTLRIDADPRHPERWRHEGDESRFLELWREVSAVPNGDEELVWHLVNLAWYSLINLATLTERSETEWLAQIVKDGWNDAS